ncbi:MAG: DMT family transporter, partial [Chloroflexi bacterium]|nr:DMT family transporter [Chloroflexota bacterium]
GAALILGAAVSTGLFNVLQKPLLRRYNPLAVTASSIWIGTICLLISAPGLGAAVREASLADTLAVVYMGVFPAALAYVLWGYLLSRLPASVVGGFSYLVAPLAAGFGWFFLSEAPSIASLVGGLVSIGGVVILNRWGR